MLAANGVDTIIQRDDGVTPTPVISHAILVYNRGRADHFADGIVITPSHNPPEDGGFKYNPLEGGPAGTDVTRWIEDRANALLKNGNDGVKRVAIGGGVVGRDHAPGRSGAALRPRSGERRGHGGDSLQRPHAGCRSARRRVAPYWQPINDVYGLNIAVVNPRLDPTFSFMTVDHDGKIRMDCSSPYAMARLVALKDTYRVAFANDPDADRHGIVTPSAAS